MKRIGEDVAEKLDYVPGRVHGGAPYPRQVGLRQLRNAGAGAGARARHRQGHPHHRAAGPGAGGQVCRSPAAVPPGGDLCRAGWPSRARPWRNGWAACGVQLQPLVDALKAEMLNTACCMPTRRRCRCSSRATARRTGPTCGPTAPGAFEDHEGRGLRLLRVARRRTRQSLPGGLEGQPDLRRLRRLQGSFAQGVTEVGCLAHARRKFFDLHANGNKSQVAQSALQQIGTIYEIERETRDLSAEERQRIRQDKSRPHCRCAAPWMLLTAQPEDGRRRRPRPKRWTTASSAGWRSRGSWTTGAAHRQQLDREPDPADCHRAQELAVCGLAAGGPSARPQS
jgi:transposase